MIGEDAPLQETDWKGALGKSHLKFFNSVKKDARPSLAGPQSPKPCSQMTTHLDAAMARCLRPCAGLDRCKRWMCEVRPGAAEVGETGFQRRVHFRRYPPGFSPIS